MTKNEVKELFNEAFVEYLEGLDKEDLSNIALVSEFEIIFFKKINEKRKER